MVRSAEETPPPPPSPGRDADNASKADKLRNQQELERLQAKFLGTGHPDTTSWEWKTNVRRDTLASIVGHRPLLTYVALAENEPVSIVRARLIRVRAPPPASSLALTGQPDTPSSADV